MEWWWGGQLVISFVFVAALMMRQGPSLWTFALVMSFCLSISHHHILQLDKVSLSSQTLVPSAHTVVHQCAHLFTRTHWCTNTRPVAHVWNVCAHTHTIKYHALTSFTPMQEHTHTHTGLHYKWTLPCVFLSFSLFSFTSPHRQLLYLVRWQCCALWKEGDGPVLLQRPDQKMRGRCLVFVSREDVTRTRRQAKSSDTSVITALTRPHLDQM